LSASPPLRLASSARDLELARELFAEYASTLPIDLAFQGFDEELATLPGRYAPPRGRLFLAGPPGEAVGCIALREVEPPPVALGGAAARRSARSSGCTCGRSRAAPAPAVGSRPAVVDAARAIGYRTLCLDTLASMREAQALYASLGFTTTARYYGPPLDDIVYYAMKL
jgi:hypothetical protein